MPDCDFGLSSKVVDPFQDVLFQRPSQCSSYSLFQLRAENAELRRQLDESRRFSERESRRYRCLNHLDSVESNLTILSKSYNESRAWKIFDREMLIKKLLTTPLQIFCKIILIFKVVIKSIKGRNDNILRNL